MPNPAPRKVTVPVIRSNALLTMLDEPGINAILESGTLVDLALDELIHRTDEAIEHVFLPIDCVLSLVTTLKDGSQIEVGSSGSEGVSAISLLLGATVSAHECYCRVPGTAVKIEAALFQSLKANPNFQKRLSRYIEAYIRTIGRLAACNALHTDCERLSRWLLMTQDRVGSPSIRLSHKHLETVLGTTPLGVTISVEALQNAGFVSSVDGFITVLDRAGLKRASCECYGSAGKDFEIAENAAGAWTSNSPSLN